MALAYDGGRVWAMEFGGVNYLLASSGSLVLSCGHCGSDHFREAAHYFEHPDWETCVQCSVIRKQRRVLRPVRVDELEEWERHWAHCADSRMPPGRLPPFDPESVRGCWQRQDDGSSSLVPKAALAVQEFAR